MRLAERALPRRHAVALGLLQGPTELTPVSSSAHTTLLPWLAGWRYGELDAEQRKSFELSLHAGAGLALAISLRGELLKGAGRRGPARTLGLLALASAPVALAGVALRRPIERRLGGPSSIAAGLLAGGAAMAIADRGAERGRRGCEQLGAADALVLGAAQAAALAPGVSRSGATLAAARARGFSRESARMLSWALALPVLLGAGGAESWRLLRGRSGLPRSAAAAGGAAAFLSTLLSARVLGRGRGPLAPYALYRCALAAAVFRRLRRAQ
jgi:undecaprenyl-diphosphatase